MALRPAGSAIVVAAAFAASAFAQGLELRSGGAVRIEIARIEARVEEGVARVEVDETFRNASADVQEGVYRFKLPEEAVVGSFSMWMEGREKRGRVMEATAARATYESIVRKRRDPGLLEQVGWREFAVRVFPIPAHDTVRVRLVYSHVVRDDLGLQTLEIPLPEKCGAVGDLRVHAVVEAAHGLASCDCPSHRDAKLEVAANRAEATFGGDGVEPKGPFLLRTVARRAGFDVTLLADRAAEAERGWFVARIVPRLERPPEIARDLVFVVDRSGSMSGRKLEQARAALVAGLATLKSGDRFDLVSFSSDVTSLGEGRLLAVNEENLARARRAAADLSASGGTAIGAALNAAIGLNGGDASRLFAVVFLTDGDPTVGETDPERILASFQKSAGSTRLFAFGVGSDVKDFLLTKLAVEGRGDARYVREEENLEVPLAALFDRVRTPLLLDPVVEVDGDGIEVSDREPRRLPDLFEGRALVVSGRFNGSGPARFHLRGRSGASEVKVDVPVEFPATTPARPHVAQIWAKARVDRLLDDMRALGPNEEMRKELLALGLAHQLVTPLTSFLVVEDGAKSAEAGAPAARPDLPTADEGSTFNGDPTAHPEYSPDPTALSDLPTGAAGGTSIGAGAGRGGNGVSPFAGRRAGGGGSGSGGVRGSAMNTASASLPFLDWFRRHQSPEGRFGSDRFTTQCGTEKCGGAGEPGYDVAATGLALLAILGHGENHATTAGDSTVMRGLRWLRSVQDEEGCFAPRTAPRLLFQHAVAALAVAEDEAISGSLAFERVCDRAVHFALQSRTAGGAWNLGGGGIDFETTAWMVLFLRSAKAAGHDVDASVLEEVIRAFDALTDPATGRVTASKDPDGGTRQEELATAVAVLVRSLAGRTIDSDPSLEHGVQYLASRPPVWDLDAGAIDLTYWQFATFALSQVGGDPWKRWCATLRTPVLEQQQTLSGSEPYGSFDPVGPGTAALGRIGSTARNGLIEELYFRYPRVAGLKPR
jgi:Ca-activated chloride channel homolog